MLDRMEVVVQAGCTAMVAPPDRAFVPSVDDFIAMDVAYKGAFFLVGAKEGAHQAVDFGEEDFFTGHGCQVSS